MSRKPESDGRRSETAAEPQTFEEAYGALHGVVAQLEDGGLDLERAIALFERGTELARSCERMLDSAQLRVTRLAGESGAALPETQAEQ